MKYQPLAVVREYFSTLFVKHLIVFISLLGMQTVAKAADLESLGYTSLSGNKTQLMLTFSEKIDEPTSFAIDDPARVVIDFSGVTNKLDKKTQQINLGKTKSVSTVEAGDRTRVVVNLTGKSAYSISQEDNILLVTIDGGTVEKTAARLKSEVTDVDFRRGADGEAKLTISLSDDNVALDVYQQRDNIMVDLGGVALPDNFHRRLDVIDFATPVQMIDSEAKMGKTQFKLSTNGKFEHLAYQTENTVVIEVKPISDEVLKAAEKDQFGYKGEKLSLNFQNIEVRSVLQLLADFTQLNLVTSDTVQGNVTLRLQNVPWDQALDIILKTKGLAMRQNGNVMLIAPAVEIAAREKQELEAKRQLVQLEPLYSEVIEINFAKAEDLEEIINQNENQNQTGGAGASNQVRGFLSHRGTIDVDKRTNSLLIRDTAEQLEQIRKLITKLDIPVRQVLIESRIVIANNDFAKDLGVRFGVTAENNNGNSLINNQGVSGTIAGTYAIRNGSTFVSDETLNVDMPVTNPAGSIALALTKLPFGSFLDLELSAMQQEGNGEIISSPKVITSNQQKATIEQGTEVPYQEASSSGATSVSFKEAVLKLDVTPQITPDDHIIMDLEVSKDSIGRVFLGIPSIDTKNVKTQVLVDNGETVVLGGVYEQSKTQGSRRVPFFGDLPYVGFLFKSTTNEDIKNELLIFVTPKIIKDELSVSN